MIKKVTIQGFQSHSDTVLEFAPGVNYILGTTDSGKTSVLRAMRWLVENRPSGNAFRSYWSEFTRVTLETDQHKIVREKGKDDFYQLNGKTKFTALRMTVPDEITNALNLSPINFQHQMDVPFLIGTGYTPGTVAEHFNKVANLSVLDRVRNNLNSDISKLTTTIGVPPSGNTKAKGLYADLIDVEEKLKKFEFIERLEVEMEVLETMENQKVAIANKVNKLQKALNTIESIKQNIKNIDDLLECEPTFQSIMDWMSNKEVIKLKYRQLAGLIAQITNTRKTIAEKSDLINLETSIDELLELKERKSTYKKVISQLSDLLYNINNTNTELLRINQNLERIEKYFHDNFPDVCPLCETVIHKSNESEETKKTKKEKNH